ncbi:peptidoglycan-binding domain-containing protein [Streptomyces cinerochromogenes]|uniref:peptidoglycan-binding domain-containing protein n=1 Tax=Streptomyces cinerochromogenes TaxID=66422 RepID=UPI0033BED84E
MTEERGTTCPECGAPRGPDNTPSCDCTERASAALRETRTAEAAAAEDFDPLRIRPYVEVSGTAGAPEPEAPRPLPAPQTPAPPAPVTRPTPLTAASGPAPEAVSEPAPGAVSEPDQPRRRSRRTVLLAVGGTALAVAAVAGSALFSYEAPARDRAAQEVRQSIPEATTPAPASPKAPAPPVTPRPPAPSTPAGPASPSSSPSPSPTATASGSPSPTASPSPSATASATPGTTPAVAPVLRRGDTGPEVTELQQRLRRLNLYGDRIDGVFTRPVEDAVRNYQLARGISGDTLGTYGPATRRALEAETTEP